MPLNCIMIEHHKLQLFKSTENISHFIIKTACVAANGFLMNKCPSGDKEKSI